MIIIASLMTPPPTRKQLDGLTYASIRKEGAAELKASWDGWNKFLTVLILTLVLGMYLYFSFWLN